MANIITVSRKSEVRINRNARGDGVVKIDSESADLLEKLLNEAGGALTAKELTSSLIKYASNDTIIRIEEV